MNSRILAMLLTFGLGASACTELDQEPEFLDMRDAVVYRQQVQGYVSRRCGTLDCHGQSDRALRIYARFSLRAHGMKRSQGMTDEEYRANVESFAALTLPGVGEDFILKKGLAPEAGGLAHVGGAVWASKEDPGYRCVEAWLNHSQDPDACRAALAIVDPDDDDDDD